VQTCEAVSATQDQIEWFHDHQYVENVKLASLAGVGYLDQGDTPAFQGVYEASALVAGTTLHAIHLIMNGQCRRAFTPIAGLHHARRHTAGGFCVFNDCGVAIEALRREYDLQRVAYVDIDAHHGDGVFYSFESDPDLIFADLHEDGRFLYPGTGAVTETGIDAAMGTKLNVPMPMGANDAAFDKVWSSVASFITKANPEFILLQCGADSLLGDPITHMAYSSYAHARATAELCKLADEHCQGRLLAMGGGGYNLENIASAWCAVVQAMIENTEER
jgi:acetoin utilization protein AcuC